MKRTCWQYIRVDSANSNLAPQPENAVLAAPCSGSDLQNGADRQRTRQRPNRRAVGTENRLGQTPLTAGLNEALDLIAAVDPELGILFNATRRGGSNRWGRPGVLVQSLGLTWNRRAGQNDQGLAEK